MVVHYGRKNNSMEGMTLTDVVMRSDEELLGALREMLLSRSVLIGDFVLKSGKSSSWFVDAKTTVCTADGMLLVGALMLRKMPLETSAIGGLTMGADPIAFATAAFASALGRKLSSFSVRKEVKDHGGGGRIAGVLSPGDLVVVTEDTATRGTSILSAVEAVEEVGAQVVAATAVVDRGGTVGELLAKRDIPFFPLVTAPELGLSYEGGL